MYNVIILSWIESTGNIILLPVIVVGLTTPSWDMKVPSPQTKGTMRVVVPPGKHRTNMGQDRHKSFVPLRGLLFFLNTAHIEILFY